MTALQTIAAGEMLGLWQQNTGAGSYPEMMMDVVGTGGSAFWKDLLGITNTIKKIKKEPTT